MAYGEQGGIGFGKKGLLRIVKNGRKKVSFFSKKIYKILGLVSPIPKLGLLAKASNPASPDLTRDYGIKSAISRRYRFRRERAFPESLSFSTLRSGIRGTYPQ